jgi:ribonuclease HI
MNTTIYHLYINHELQNIDCHIYCQWIPAHVGIGPNKEANDIARLCAGTYSADTQNTTPIELKALKSTLK